MQRSGDNDNDDDEYNNDDNNNVVENHIHKDDHKYNNWGKKCDHYFVMDFLILVLLLAYLERLSGLLYARFFNDGLIRFSWINICCSYCLN